ncbi:MAG: D-glycero-beta-D-manno-heptose 1-phosphate adenylyltransferase [Spirochaetes bacterium]|nr:D-glycero-beta-D-manno-heptose 1-phosphate adenylyltransferase [Spirochaetota bacterium]
MRVKPFKDKVVDFEKIDDVCRQLRQENKTIATTNGCFDILHLGHVEYLQAASEICDCLIVGINSQDSVRKLKGSSRPVNSEISRVSVIASLGFVDFCVIFSQDTPVELLKKVKPDVHIKGGDYKPEELIEKKVVEDNGGIIQILPLVTGYSTSSIIGKLKSE